jgi:hypothetical protein
MEFSFDLMGKWGVQFSALKLMYAASVLAEKVKAGNSRGQAEGSPAIVFAKMQFS